ncbi:ribokinase [Lysinibacter sp. HNR]|uniref:ribokinase n=1 Tax=Lysinibacter sp. HNR TaxID=3031408 RepID=UPI00243582B7|nr:ribokinase [Lysinibacter sp. HNR]WGD37764.1 ribokinase [Lysinibacter sp. HNR]
MKIAIVGSYGVGLTMRVSQVPRAGETLSGGVFASGHGGKGSNQAVAASRLGADVTFLTAVGNDEYSRSAHELWATEGIDASHVVTVQEPTMAGFILVEESGENRIIIAPGALEQLTAEHVHNFTEVLASADMVIVSLEIPVPVALEALRIAHEHGTRTLLNPAPAAPIPREAWAWIDVVTPNRTEAEVLLGNDLDNTHQNPEHLAKQLHSITGTDVVITLGADGAVLATHSGIQHVTPVAPKQIVDTTGAGDSFTAALAVALTEGHSLHHAARFAAHVGAHAVSIAEVIPALPRRDQVPEPGTR